MSITYNGQLAARPLLTEEDVLRWKADLNRLEGEIEAASRAAAELRRKLDAAAVFMPQAQIEPPQQAALFQDAITLVDVIEMAVKEAPGPLTPKAIRNAIRHGPHSALLTSENYLYTAIKRVADKGKIIKGDRGYVPGPF